MMNDRKRAFLAAYLTNGGNATEAAKAAGYSEKTAHSQGPRLLKDAGIAAEIAATRKEVAAAARYEAAQFLTEGLEIAQSDIADYFDADGNLKALKDIPVAQRRAIASIEVEAETEKHGKIRKIKLWPKMEARDQLARHLGFYEADNAQIGQSYADLVLAAQRKREGKR